MKIQFDPGPHIYRVDGLVKPSVSQILNESGLVTSFYKDNGAKERGTEIHRLTLGLDLGTFLPWEEEGLEPYMRQYRSFLADFSPLYTAMEYIAYNMDLGYCGTADRVGTSWPGTSRPFILDLKTGTTIPGFTNLQTAAYAMALFDDDVDNIDRYALHLNPKRKDYRLVKFTDPSDFKTWERLCREYAPVA